MNSHSEGASHFRVERTIAIRLYEWCAGFSRFNPEGIASFSPGLRGTRYPGFAIINSPYPEGVLSNTERRESILMKRIEADKRRLPSIEPLQGRAILCPRPRVAPSRNPGLNDGIPSGFSRHNRSPRRSRVSNIPSLTSLAPASDKRLLVASRPRSNPKCPAPPRPCARPGRR
jgi:hypothetical protein